MRFISHVNMTKDSLLEVINRNQCEAVQLPVCLHTFLISRLAHESWVMSYKAGLCLRRQTASPQPMWPLCFCSHNSTAHTHTCTHAHTHTESHHFWETLNISLRLNYSGTCDRRFCQDGQQTHRVAAGSNSALLLYVQTLSNRWTKKQQMNELLFQKVQNIEVGVD